MIEKLEKLCELLNTELEEGKINTDCHQLGQYPHKTYITYDVDNSLVEGPVYRLKVVDDEIRWEMTTLLSSDTIGSYISNQDDRHRLIRNSYSGLHRVRNNKVKNYWRAGNCFLF